MSIFTNIANAEHTFAAWAEKEWSVIYKAAPKVEQIAAVVLKYAGPAIQTVITAEAGGPAGAIVGKVLLDAQAGLVATSGLIYDFGATPSVTGSLESIQSNLSDLLSAGHISNATNVATITKVVNELALLAKAFPTA